MGAAQRAAQAAQELPSSHARANRSYPLAHTILSQCLPQENNFMLRDNGLHKPRF